MKLIDSSQINSPKKQSSVAFELVEKLRQGSLLIAPIEQGYVFVADPYSESAINSIKELRGLGDDVYFPMIVSGVDQISPYCSAISPEQRILAMEFWPGTLIFECQTIPGLLQNFGSKFVPETLYFRYASNSLLNKVCELAGALLYSPVMKDGSIATNRRTITENFSSSCDYFIPAKKFNSRAVPTIVRFDQSGPTLTKVGDIEESRIRKLIPNLRSI